MKDVLHLLSADTNPIHPRYEVTLCLHRAWTASPRSKLTEIKTRTCRPLFRNESVIPVRRIDNQVVCFFLVTQMCSHTTKLNRR